MKNISNYYQPDFYRFTEESLELVDFAKELLSPKKDVVALDLCSGCGVIGIEALTKFPNIQHMTFLELQNEFMPFLKDNIDKAECDSFKIIQDSLGNSSFESKQFDLILSNPPYFGPGEGRASPNVNRQICRSFEVDGWKTYFEKVGQWLKNDGLFFFSTKELNPVESYFKKFKLIKKKQSSSAWLVCLSQLDID